MVWRLLPLIGLLLFLFELALRAWLQARRYGSSGVMLFRSRSRRQQIGDALFVLLLLVMMRQAVAAAISPDALSSRAALPLAMVAALRPVGAVLLLGGLGLLPVAQLHLGASWRVGIEEGARPGLVTTGMYCFCRNPIFLFILVMFLGYTILLPTWLSLALLAATFLGMRHQVLAEEAYLLRAYGDTYRAYARGVGRFLPWLGRYS